MIRVLTLTLMILVIRFASTNAQPYCIVEEVYETISCGETVYAYSGGGLATEIFEFVAVGGEVRAFVASAPFPPDQLVQIWIASPDCQTIFVIDPASLGPSAEICPFTVPSSGRYFVAVVSFGGRGFTYPLTMHCLNPINPDCGTVPIEERTWGRIKALFKQ